MTRFEIAKQTNAMQYLSSIGVAPVKETASMATYYSPFRQERTPSFVVYKNTNTLHDYGDGWHGSLIDFVRRIESCNSIEAVNSLLKGECKPFFSTASTPIIKAPRERGVEIVEVCDIKHYALRQYVEVARQIPYTIYNKYLKEVHYRCGDREYFAVGFQNDGGGWVLRNKLYKMCTSQHYTHLNNGSRYLAIFEGVFDFLTYLTCRASTGVEIDYLVLNSTSNIGKAMPIIEGYDVVGCYLDNDTSGRNTLNKIRDNARDVKDYSHIYKDYNDYNEWFCSTQKSCSE